MQTGSVGDLQQGKAILERPKPLSRTPPLPQYHLEDGGANEGLAIFITDARTFTPFITFVTTLFLGGRSVTDWSFYSISQEGNIIGTYELVEGFSRIR